MEKIEITKEQVEALFAGTNFGPRGETHEGRIALMVDCVFKGFAGYSSGSTIEGICVEAGLLSAWNKPTRPEHAGLTIRCFLCQQRIILTLESNNERV